HRAIQFGLEHPTPAASAPTLAKSSSCHSDLTERLSVPRLLRAQGSDKDLDDSADLICHFLPWERAALLNRATHSARSRAREHRVDRVPGERLRSAFKPVACRSLATHRYSWSMTVPIGTKTVYAAAIVRAGAWCRGECRTPSAPERWHRSVF